MTMAKDKKITTAKKEKPVTEKKDKKTSEKKAKSDAKKNKSIKLKKDIWGAKKVRTTAEYTAATHWAGSISFAAVFTAPVLYLILPVLVLYVTGCFELLAGAINNVAGSAILDQYGAMGIVTVLLWQIVVCWIVWLRQVRKYEATPKYQYHFYNDIVEYNPHDPETPKFIKTLKFLINLIPTIVMIAILAVVAIFLVYLMSSNPSTPPADTPVVPDAPSVPSETPGAGSTTDWSAILAFITDEKVLPFVLIIVAVIIVAAIISAIVNALQEKKAPTEGINMKTINARTLPAVISATKKLPSPKYAVPDNCPRWLKKIIFWAPVRYNFGDVIIASPKGANDDIVLSKIEKPEELINYLSPIKPEPTETASYSANR